MNSIKKITMMLILCVFCASIEAASVNVTLSSQNIQNGSSLDILAKFDPAIGTSNFNNVYYSYSISGEAGSKRLTSYLISRKRIVINSALPSSEFSRLTIASSANQTVLTISPITFDDEKRVFFCSLEYIVSGSILITIRSRLHTLENVYSKAVLNDAESMQMSTIMTEGVPSNLTCIAIGRPAPNITWQYNSTINGSVSSTHVGSPIKTVTSVLTIQNPSHVLQNQNITCIVNHPFTSTMKRTTSIYIYYTPAQVQFKALSMPINGLSMTLTCTASSEVPPSFRFILVNGSTSVIVQDGSSTTYTTLPLDYKDHNNYKAMFQCVSYNRVGESPPLTLILDIQVRPEISIPSTIIAVEGQDVVLQCKIIAANPVANVTWRSPTGTAIFSANGTALLSSVRRRQHGEYYCLASNGIGSSASKATCLLVNYAPEFIQKSVERLGCIGETVSIDCNADGHPTPDVFLYLNGTLLKQALTNLSYNVTLDSERKFGPYQCVANSTFGIVNVTSTFKMKASGGVNNVIMHIKESAIRVTWQLPQCSGNIREIKVQYRKKGQTNWQWELKAATIADKEMTITSLEKGEEYEVRVVVVDTNGMTHETIGRKAAKAGMQSTNNGALIGGIVGGVCFMAIILLACILVAKKRDQTSAAEESIGNITRGIDVDMTSPAAIELGKIDSTHYMAPDESVYGTVKEKFDNYRGCENEHLVTQTDNLCQ